MDEKQRRLREVFGPRPEAPVPGRPAIPARRRWRPGPHTLVLAAVAAIVAASAWGYFAVTPTEHVAPGCWWWTAKSVGEVMPGTKGCVRGYYARGGIIAESRDSLTVALHHLTSEPDTPPLRVCPPFQPGDPIVFRYHAVSDDGRIIIVVDDCR
jgi:hypothetical protein